MLSTEDGNRMLRLGQFGSGRPRASADLRHELVARARARSSELTDSVSARYRHELAAYSESLHAFDGGATRRLAQATVETLLSSVEDATPLRDGLQVDFSAESLVVSSFPPAALLGAYEAAGGMVWRFLADELAGMGLSYGEYGEMLSAVGGMIFEVSARMSGALRQRLGINGNGSASGGDAARQNVFNALLVSPHLGERTLAEAADRVGFHLSRAHVVVLVALRRNGRARKAGPGAVAEIESILSSVQVGNQQPIVEARAADLVSIYPSKREGVRRRLSSRIAAALRNAELPGGIEARVALGGEEEGVAGISTSYEQARRTLEALEAMSTSERVVAYPEMLPTLLLLENPRLAAEIRRCTVDLLERHDEGQQGELASTLEALVAERGNVSAAALRLQVHRHTLAARQDLIERITGISFQNPRDLLLLELGVQATQITFPDDPIIQIKSNERGRA